MTNQDRVPRGSSPLGLLTLLLAVLVYPGAETLAQEVGTEESTAGSGEEASTVRFVPPEGPVYTWRDGDRTRRVFLQEDLVVTRNGSAESQGIAVRPAGNERIVRVSAASRSEGQPVFRSQSGALMTLPGGVLLVFDATWGTAQTDAFLAANGIAKDRVSPLGEIPNGFVVETEPGFPSLELANTLAGKDGVKLASPNWWREITTY